MPKKVAGARWEGTKTRLDSNSDSEGSGEGSDTSGDITKDSNGGWAASGSKCCLDGSDLACNCSLLYCVMEQCKQRSHELHKPHELHKI